RDHEFCRRRGPRPLQPGGRRHARSHHPHQELAPGGRRARERQNGSLQGRRAGGGEGVHRALRELFRAPECARRRHQEGARSAAARRARPRPRAVRPRAIEVIADAEAIGRFESISEAEMFDMEYWSLEQAKLSAAAEKPLAGQIAVITGAGGTIGAATAKAFARAGAEVALLDLDEGAAAARAKELGGASLPVKCDVTDANSVSAAFERVVEAFGGVDI